MAEAYRVNGERGSTGSNPSIKARHLPVSFRVFVLLPITVTRDEQSFVGSVRCLPPVRASLVERWTKCRVTTPREERALYS
jgi:hypothetical protein